jgi:hypothetical protein
MKNFLPFLLLFGLFACRDKGESRATIPDPEGVTSMKPVHDTSFIVVLTADTAVGPIYGYLDSGKTVSCYLRVGKPVHLEAELVALTPGLNLRFSQLFIPDSTADGPFGNTLTYQLGKTGTYRLVLAPNLMAEGQTTGEYLVRFNTQ